MTSISPLRWPSAIIFDIGDTLLPAGEIGERALASTADWLLQRTGVNPDVFIDAYRTSDAHRRGPTVNHLWGLPLDIIGDACGHLGVSASHGLAAGAVYRDGVRQAIRYDPSLVATFHALHESGLRLGVVSDGTTVEQLDTLHLLGVLPFVDALAISEDVGHEKPHPAIFETALEALGVEPRDTWYLGDDVEVDYEGADRVGMQPLLVGNVEREDLRHIPSAPAILSTLQSVERR
ncbi:MAG TPA: HAD family hydrolase [Solirubrobacteraceae bacterium]|jgi:HAD superfamily hydrolase (TIGR01509 family)|nr:HAD family hydrolase [Solirubrobacteraceae bacterium]